MLYSVGKRLSLPCQPVDIQQVQRELEGYRLRNFPNTTELLWKVSKGKKSSIIIALSCEGD